MTAIAFSNQKGGVGKSTLAGFLAIYLVKQGYKVLAMDGDAQGNLTERLTQKLDGGGSLPLTGASMSDLFEPNNNDIEVMRCPLGMDLIHTPNNDFDLYDKESISIEDSRWPQKNTRQLRRQYDFVVIDTPPTLGRVQLASLLITDRVFIPVQLSGFAIGGLSGLINTVERLQDGLNPEISIGGVVVNRLRTGSSRQQKALGDLREALGDAVLESVLYDRNPIDTAVDEGLDIDTLNYAHVASKEVSAVMQEIVGRL